MIDFFYSSWLMIIPKGSLQFALQSSYNIRVHTKFLLKHFRMIYIYHNILGNPVYTCTKCNKHHGSNLQIPESISLPTQLMMARGTFEDVGHQHTCATGWLSCGIKSATVFRILMTVLHRVS